MRLQFQPSAFTYHLLSILGKAGKGFSCEALPPASLCSPPHHSAPSPRAAPIAPQSPAAGAVPARVLSLPFLFPTPRPPRPWKTSLREWDLPLLAATRARSSLPAPGPLCTSELPSLSRREELRSLHSKRGMLSLPCWKPLAFIPWRWGLFPSPPAQAPAAGTDPSLPSCSSPPYLLSSPQSPPPPSPRRETPPGRRHGNARHRRGAPRSPSDRAQPPWRGGNEREGRRGVWRSIALAEPPAQEKPPRRAATQKAGCNRWAAAAAVSQAGERGGRA